ncbi:MAG: hypothetical protein AAF171_14030 [Cyanobacteria bacterium P01_A01_bin.116]
MSLLPSLVSIMQGQWQTLISKLLFWLMVEIILNLVGLDNVADYSEFLLGDRTISIPTPQQVISLPL